MAKILILCIDGLGPAYLDASPTPTIDRMAAEGTLTIGQSVIPSVTNVNNVSIITGVPPSLHGITSNYMLDVYTGQETYMESVEFLCYPSAISRAKALGMTTAVVTAKQKLLQLVGKDADLTLCAENPPSDMVSKVGIVGDIYSPDINLWLLRALRVLLRERDPDLVYCATTDGMMHKYGPDQEASIRHIQGLDAILGQILEDDPDRKIYLTADHGMSDKHWGVDLERVLSAQQIRARAIPIIKDRYVVHHGNLGGASYVYLHPEVLPDAIAILGEAPGVEAVYPRREAARHFDLMAERIGDLLVLADADTVFGSFQEARVDVQLRSHGSRHESSVPILAYGGSSGGHYCYNYEVVAHLGLGQ